MLFAWNKTFSELKKKKKMWRQGMWDLPGSGIRPVAPALVCEFFTTEPPGKPLSALFCVKMCLT